MHEDSFIVSRRLECSKLQTSPTVNCCTTNEDVANSAKMYTALVSDAVHEMQQESAR